MPNPRLLRWVSAAPKVTYFKPQGVPLDSLEEISLCVEGLEALRLADMLGLTAEEAAVGMGVSRHTFGRILGEARAKVARALVTGTALRIEGGHYEVATAAQAVLDHRAGSRQARSACEEAVRQTQTREEKIMRRGSGSQCGRGGAGGGGGGGGGGGQGRCGQGQGRGQGQGGRGGGSCGQGRGFSQGAGDDAQGGGGFSQVDTGMCQCPQCGQSAAHKPGVPCTEMRCPACGAEMVRQ